MVGATGPNAGLVLPELIKRGVVVRALVRDEERAASARTKGEPNRSRGPIGGIAVPAKALPAGTVYAAMQRIIDMGRNAMVRRLKPRRHAPFRPIP